ncbi:hypothetical protein D3C80_1419200 [compost metagenome]
MDKEFKLHTALAIEQRQTLCCDIDANLFHDFALCGMRRRFGVFKAAGDRLPELRIVTPL